MAGRFIWVEERLGSIPSSPTSKFLLKETDHFSYRYPNYIRLI